MHKADQVTMVTHKQQQGSAAEKQYVTLSSKNNRFWKWSFPNQITLISKQQKSDDLVIQKVPAVLGQVLRS